MTSFAPVYFVITPLRPLEISEAMSARISGNEKPPGCQVFRLPFRTELVLIPEQVVTAIHQGFGGLLRRTNNLARGALVAAASEKCNTVSAEHVCIASTEIIY